MNICLYVILYKNSAFAWYAWIFPFTPLLLDCHYEPTQDNFTNVIHYLIKKSYQSKDLFKYSLKLTTNRVEVDNSLQNYYQVSKSIKILVLVSTPIPTKVRYLVPYIPKIRYLVILVPILFGILFSMSCRIQLAGGVFKEWIRIIVFGGVCTSISAFEQ